MEFRDVLDLIKSEARPLQLGFRRPEAVHDYFVTLGEGALGIKLGKNKAIEISAAVEEVFGAALASGQVEVGDFLVSVNAVDTTALTFSQTVCVVKDSPRPIRLHFDRSGVIKCKAEASAKASRQIARDTLESEKAAALLLETAAVEDPSSGTDVVDSASEPAPVEATPKEEIAKAPAALKPRPARRIQRTAPQAEVLS